MVIGNLLIYAIGVPYLATAIDTDLGEALVLAEHQLSSAPRPPASDRVRRPTCGGGEVRSTRHAEPVAHVRP